MNCTPRPLDSSFLFAKSSQMQLGLMPSLIGLLFVATGCTTTHQVSGTQFDVHVRATEVATGKTVKVYFRDGRLRESGNLYTGLDSTMGGMPQNQEERSFPAASTWKVEMTDQVVGFLEGAGLEIGVPIAGGLLLDGGGDDSVSELVRKAGYRLSIPAGLTGTFRGHQET